MQVLFSSSANASEREVWLSALRRALPEAGFHDAADRTDPQIRSSIRFAVVANPAPGTLQGLPALCLIQSLWAGVDRLLADPTLPAGVPIARMVDPAMTEAMVQTALWATLGLHRGFFAYARQQQARQWHQLPQRRASDVRVAVLGLGEMGAAVARRLSEQGYPVSGWRARAGQPGSAGTGFGSAMAPGAGYEVSNGFDALPGVLAGAQIVLNLLPLTPATDAILDARFFARLPMGASVVNLARGAHLVEADLLVALDSGRVGHAVLDVFAGEPLDATHPFWVHPRVTVLPHVAALSDVANSVAVVRANLLAVSGGREPAHRIDRQRGY